MIYRECGVFKATYRQDMAIFPIPLDRWGMAVILFVAFLGMPFLASDYWLSSILVPFLVFSLGALGLNFLTGYAGQISLGQAGFMAVGAYTSLILYGRYDVPLLLSLLGGGLVAAAVGAVFGIPSLRIKGFYLAVSTLAAQFIIEWVLTHWKWVSGGVFGTGATPPMKVFGRVLLCRSGGRLDYLHLLWGGQYRGLQPDGLLPSSRNDHYRGHGECPRVLLGSRVHYPAANLYQPVCQIFWKCAQIRPFRLH